MSKGGVGEGDPQTPLESGLWSTRAAQKTNDAKRSGSNARTPSLQPKSRSQSQPKSRPTATPPKKYKGLFELVQHPGDVSAYDAMNERTGLASVETLYAPGELATAFTVAAVVEMPEEPIGDQPPVL